MSSPTRTWQFRNTGDCVFLASLAPPMRRSACQRQNLLRFLLRKILVFFRPARLPSALLLDAGSGAPWGSSWFWVLLSLRRPHRWTQALNRSHPNSAFCFASHPIFNLSEDLLRGDSFLGLVAQRLVHFPRHPQPMQQHRQFPGHRDHRPLLRILAAALARLQSPPPQVRIRPRTHQ